MPAEKSWDGSAWLRGIFALLTVFILLVAGFVVGRFGSGENSKGPSSLGADDVAERGVDSRSVSSGGSEPTAQTLDSFLEVEQMPLEGISSEPVADVADVVSPSIVMIVTEKEQGSGVVWDAANGYIVTNNHVVETSTNVDVEFPDGQTVVGTVIGGDSTRDLAVIGVDPDEVNSLVQAVFAPTSEVRVGQLAVAIGGPFGLDQSVTAGVVSAVNRVAEGGSDRESPGPVEMIQTDAPINPGNSGGALADRFGRVIGISTLIRTTSLSGGSIGLGFAIPSDTVVLIAGRIVRGESLDVGFLGIQGETPTDGSPGALVTSVVDGSPADDSGIKAGDLIVAVNGKEISSMADLAAEIKLFRPGEAVDILLLRDGTRLTVRAILTSA
ncbi:MAG: PDZ domain-containing protein [Acidimicrobiaceae bacterium]|nr:PDZ domain-containing protein [Acidimicrobiaceae bacterium]MYA75707.1 PDZ domain-containing protein [Acidimicrobiaceae bacterium]MYC41240.1 PDZ domain-containing protein [Acidimicrobiaceae bacterium]MYD08067.1 PDZ domain-containing protein [Acidimicrobiaceae bacterium]MYJ98003.1 PDZ domain-containing protein [Acidimicrobiaceae bacterium]